MRRGRPRRFDKSSRIGVLMTADMFDAVYRVAAMRKTNMAAVVRDLVQRQLEAQKITDDSKPATL